MTHNNDTTLALQVFTKLIRAAETVTAEVHRDLSKHSLSISQFGVLEALFHIGPMCQKEIGQKILKSSGNITLVIDNLQKRELIQRERSKDDRRFFSISLTPKGKSLIEHIFPPHAEKIAEKMSVLQKSELEELGRLCRKFKQLRED